MLYPNYNRSVLSVTASCLRHYGINTPINTLPECDRLLETNPQNVIIILCDGLSANLQDRFLPNNSIINSTRIATVTTVFPSTTTAATTSVWTGQTPASHGWLGWTLYFKEMGRVVDTFLSQDHFTNERLPIDPAVTLMPYTNIYELISSKGVPTYAFNPFETYTLHGATHQVINPDFGKSVSDIISLTRAPGKKFITLYNTQPDHDMHNVGVNTQRTRDNFKKINSEIERLAKDVQNACVFLISDHGLVDVKQTVDLRDIPELYSLLSMPVTIEARAASIFVRPNCEELFANYFNACFGDKFILMPRKEVFDKELFGPGVMHKKVNDFVGSFMAIATGDISITCSALNSKPYNLIGQHGGLTDDEMLVAVSAITK